MRLFVLFISLLFLSLLTSCYPERKIIKNYIDYDENLRFVILSSDFIFKNNLKSYEIENFEELPQDTADSLLFSNSLFLQYVDDSIFLQNFGEAFIQGLTEYSVDVFQENQLDSLMNTSASVTILNIAQVLMEEYVGVHQDEAYIMDQIITSDEIDVDAISISMWFEINPMNQEEEEHLVLFASNELSDTIQGRFVQYFFSGNVGYEYQVDPLTLEDIYIAANRLGYQYAGYLYDYFLNKYIAGNLPAGQSPLFIYHYDPIKKKISAVNETGFIDMTN